MEISHFYGYKFTIIDWCLVCWIQYYSIQETKSAVVRINNLGCCLGAAALEYARWRASMRSTFGWKFQGDI